MLQEHPELMPADNRATVANVFRIRSSDRMAISCYVLICEFLSQKRSWQAIARQLKACLPFLNRVWPVFEDTLQGTVIASCGCPRRRGTGKCFAEQPRGGKLSAIGYEERNDKRVAVHFGCIF
jgi:hypothetical protein